MKNPVTGEDILVPAKSERVVPKFVFSKSIKEKTLCVDPSLLRDESEDETQEDSE
jgi:hypothetical protein